MEQNTRAKMTPVTDDTVRGEATNGFHLAVTNGSTNGSGVTVSWKRKMPRCPGKSAIFEEEEEEEEEYSNEIIPFKRRCMALEDRKTVCKRLKGEGVTLAEADRYWEALSKFQEAIDLHLEGLADSHQPTGAPSDKKEPPPSPPPSPAGVAHICASPDIAVLHEMSSQCYSELSEVYPAVASAEKAVWYDRVCAVACQTLARTQINIGELLLAKRSVQRGLHLNPLLPDAREDLDYTIGLIDKMSSTEWTELPVVTRPGIVCCRCSKDTS